MKDWSKHAILVIDIQYDSLDNTEDFPSFQDNITTTLLAYARKSGIEVIHIRVTFKPGKSDSWVEGPHGAEVAPFAKRHPMKKCS